MSDITEKEKERRRKISETLKGFKRPPFTAEHRAKLAKANLGKIPCPEVVEATRKRMMGNKYALGKKHSEEWKQKMRGRIPWNKGLGMSRETKEKVSLSKLGVPSTRKGKPMLSMRGSRHPNWKGGCGELRLLRSQIESIEWRRRVFERDDFTCQECGLRGVYLNAHHIKRFKDFPELRHDIDNGITLCSPCHNLTKGKEEDFEKRYNEIICRV